MLSINLAGKNPLPEDFSALSALSADRQVSARNMASVYFLKSQSLGKSWIYVGSTDNLENRLKQHEAGDVVSTKSKRPLKLIYSEVFETISEARIRERKIKHSRFVKESIVRRFK